jgi:hypothetical protein
MLALSLAITAIRRRLSASPGGGGAMPANALTIGGQPLTLAGETLTLGSP